MFHHRRLDNGSLTCHNHLSKSNHFNDIHGSVQPRTKLHLWRGRSLRSQTLDTPGFHYLQKFWMIQILIRPNFHDCITIPWVLQHHIENWLLPALVVRRVACHNLTTNCPWYHQNVKNLLFSTFDCWLPYVNLK